MLLRSAEMHGRLDAGAVVPAAVEQHDLLRRWQVAHITLEIPLGVFPVTGLARRNHPRLARAQVLDDALDGAVLASAVASLEDYQDLQLVGDDVVVQLDQLDLQPSQLALVFFLTGPRNRLACLMFLGHPLTP